MNQSWIKIIHAMTFTVQGKITLVKLMKKAVIFILMLRK